jgi:L-ascorbate metabolism protein UlaG (beta-lactamase superfamily)
MKIKWLGHATFLITSDDGIRIITDPYKAGMGMQYGDITESAEIVSVSHGHGDHNNVAAVQGNPEVVDEVGSVEKKGIKIKGILTHHDDAGGSKRGNNIVFCFNIDNMNVCHLGDLGHPLSDKQAADIGEVDIVMVPVGGNFTIDAGVATDVVSMLKARVVLPMHYQNDRCPGFPVAGVDDFLRGKSNVVKPDTSEAEYSQSGLPDKTQVVVLKPAL